MKKINLLLVIILTFILGVLVGCLIKTSKQNPPIDILNTSHLIREKPLEKYAIENLSKTKINPGKFKIKNVMNKEKTFTSHLFEFTFDPTVQEDSLHGNKKVTGQINMPSSELQIRGETFPIVLMLRGYVDQELYKTGDGTRNAAKFFTENGFITIAPDFLGYANSSEEAENIFESRFQTYTTTLSLIESLDQVNSWDKENIFIWAHSNGGQVALTILEIRSYDFPTTLWAPVTESFPYSILYYTNEAEDRGKLIRGELGKFEELYDVEKYSLANFVEKINAPIQIHQGTNDDAIPMEWTYRFINKLKSLDKEYEYHEYPGANHNLVPAWNTAINRDLEFFNSYFDK